jgi:large subunit ribosomal protein L32
VGTCPECGEAKLPHHACPECGDYKGKNVIATDDD